MNIKKYEFKKIISSPIFIVLTLIFLAYNAMIITNKSYIRNDLKVLNKIFVEVGYVINDDMMVEFKTYYESQLEKANNILSGKGYNSYDTISEFFEENYIYADENSKFSSDEVRFLDKASSIEAYYFLSRDLEQSYESIDINKIAEYELAKSPYNNNVNKIIKKNYNEFDVRFQELKANGEHKNLFFHGRTYKMHSFLFKNIFTAIIYEIMILIVLATSFILNYEFESKTALVVYSTKRGRHLTKDKLIVSLGFTILATTIIISITLLTYFITFDYSGLWGVSVNSFFGQEYSMPYMSWWSMSILKYLVLVILVVYLIEIIFCGITFILSVFIKNTYIVFGTFAIILGIGILLPEVIPTNLDIIIYSVYTPFTLILNPSWWFMFRGGLLQPSKYYEIITLIIWSVIVLVIGALCVKRVKRENIK